MINPFNKPRKTLALAVVALALAVLLAACGGQVGVDALRVTMVPNADLGYSVDIDEETGVITYTVTDRTLVASRDAGATPMILTGYEIAFYDRSGNEVFAGGERQRGSLDVFVPGGYACDEPGPRGECSLRDAGATYAPGPQIPALSANQLLPIAVASEHFNSGAEPGWRAEVVFTGEDVGSGASFTTQPYPLAIVYPNN